MSRLCLDYFVGRFPDRALEGAGNTYQVIVVVAGIVGLAAARTRQDLGFRMKVLERRRGVGREVRIVAETRIAFILGGRIYCLRYPVRAAP